MQTFCFSSQIHITYNLNRDEFLYSEILKNCISFGNFISYFLLLIIIKIILNHLNRITPFTYFTSLQSCQFAGGWMDNGGEIKNFIEIVKEAG